MSTETITRVTSKAVKPNKPAKKAPVKIHPSFGLSSADMAHRAVSIGASDCRIICNGTDEEIDRLWRQKRGETVPDEGANSVAAQFGHYTENFHRMWVEGRIGTPITRAGERVEGAAHAAGMHVNLDGYVGAIPPHDLSAAEFEMKWMCPKPSKPVQAIFEMKWRNGRQFDDEEQLEKFLPQLHHAMFLTGEDYAALSTFTSDLQFVVRVVSFDDAYWAKCKQRIDAFMAAVRGNYVPEKFEPLAVKIAAKRTILRTVAMDSDPENAAVWAFHAAALLKSAPTAAEAAKMATMAKAKKELGALVPKDVGIVHGAGVRGERTKTGALRFFSGDANTKGGIL